MELKQLKTIIISFILILLVIIPSPLFVSDVVKADAVPPTIVINFAGNLSDSGGPYYRPPGESDVLDEAGEGVWRDGYYTNDSRQQEGWMYINLTVEDGDGVPNVWLQWKNESTWTNYTYPFLNTSGGYFEFNTSGNFSTAEGYNYSFNIVANDTIGNSDCTWWNKTGLDGSDTRRCVQLNCSQVNISYTPYYFYDAIYPVTNNYDRLHHDQGAAVLSHDTGYLLSDVPTEVVQERYCSGYIGWWFDDSVCMQPDDIDSIYYHIWWDNDDGGINLRLSQDRTRLTSAGGGVYYDETSISDSVNNRSEIYYDGGQIYDDYTLTTFNYDATDRPFTENNITEFATWLYSISDKPTLISNRSFTSFILLNVPDNATLDASHNDTDGDGLWDRQELYDTFTNPFLADTDNDGVNDYDETLSSSDPNNYTDTIEYYTAVGYPNGYFYFETEAPHQYSMAVAYDETWHYYTMS